MTVNQTCGILAAVALAATIWFGATHHKPVSIEKPAPTVIVPPVVERPPLIKPVKPAPVKPTPGTVYHRVTQGGGKGDSVECKSVVPYTTGKTSDELKATAKQLGVTQADLAKYFVCVTD